MAKLDSYVDYIALSDKIKALQNKQKVLAEQVIKRMEREGLEKAETDRGLISRVKSVTYKYSTVIAEVEKEIKELKKNERENDLAEAIEKYSLRVTLR